MTLTNLWAVVFDNDDGTYGTPYLIFPTHQEAVDYVNSLSGGYKKKYHPGWVVVAVRGALSK